MINTNFRILLTGAVASLGLALAGCNGGGSSGLTDNCAADEIELTASDGRILCVGLKTVASEPFTQGYFTARVLHKITVKDKDGDPIDVNTDAVITGIEQTPEMAMVSGMNHATPQGSIDTSDSANGIYTIPTYYVMASGAMMGEWTITISLTDGANTLDADFNPTVDMVMAPNVFAAKGSNAGDTYNPMGMATPRDYRAWLDSIAANAGGGHDLTLFISAVDAMQMMGMTHKSFPAIYQGQTLHDATFTAYLIGAVTVRVSTDGGTTWQALSADGSGYFSGTGLSGFTAGQQVTLDVELTVDGLQMQTATPADPQLVFTVPN